MDFETSIDASVLASALTAHAEEDAAAAHRHGFTVDVREGNHAVMVVHEAMHPQNNLVADLTWEATDGGSRVHCTYRTPTEEEARPTGVMAPILAYLTMMILVGGIMWGAGFGLLHLIMHENKQIIGLLALVAPVVYLTSVIVRTSTARIRAKRRFEKLMKDMFFEEIK